MREGSRLTIDAEIGLARRRYWRVPSVKLDGLAASREGKKERRCGGK
jgi:hypothetical protein